MVKKVIKKNLLIKTFVGVALLLLLSIGGVTNSTNGLLKKAVYQFTGVEQLDSSIILITIDDYDIQQLQWPLKRNYYALLIDRLNDLGAAVIGMEIFLSGKPDFQSVYDELLMEKIAATESIVLGSIGEGVTRANTIYFADSLLFPQPKYAVENAVTGHLNYFENGGISIPAEITDGTFTELAFSIMLADAYGYEEKTDENLHINFYNRGSSFHSYSLLEFFKLDESGAAELQSIRGKIVIIGVSSSEVSRNVVTPFDDRLPGPVLHAFALDNILTGRERRTGLYTASTVLFLFGAFLLVFLVPRKKYLYYGFFIPFLVLILSLLLFRYGYYELNFGALFLPLLFFGLAEIFINLLIKEEALNETQNEAELLRKALTAKESMLQELQGKLANTEGESAGMLKQQIASLKEEITAFQTSKAEREPAELTAGTGSEAENFEGIIYKSDKMGQLTGMIKKVAPEDVTILILGESGSGKELVARAVHNLSNRKDESFVAMNCAAMSDSLLESELFGHKRGAFTGAVADKKGLFEAANKGTIFLDEIGETSEHFQVRLLRVLQNGEIQKIGATETSKVDTRVIAATNKNLEKLIKEKKFREDLFYRLKVIVLELPPLRERREDIEVLAVHFLRAENSKLRLSKGVLKQLMEYDWKGNVRELQSAMKRASILASAEERDVIYVSDLPDDLAELDRSDIGIMILDSLRNKGFSHNAINETAKELGGLNRTVVSENFRGLFFKYYCENEYNLQKTALKLADSDENEVISKVKSKISTYLKNIEKDVLNSGAPDIEHLKNRLASKYKNLPKKYHPYLDTLLERLFG